MSKRRVGGWVFGIRPGILSGYELEEIREQLHRIIQIVSGRHRDVPGLFFLCFQKLYKIHQGKSARCGAMTASFDRFLVCY